MQSPLPPRNRHSNACRYWLLNNSNGKKFMSVTLKEVDHIAALAKLEFSDAEKEKFTHQFNDILKYMEELNSVDTSNVEPLAQVIELQNVFREDIVEPSTPTDDALKNAPEATEEHFKVPKVIG
jgi:aspartyl-tRNA(Asn)/glutamyl-tRNA(Gln) amidotransferase subunit C